jgi:hypothetical protein
MDNISGQDLNQNFKDSYNAKLNSRKNESI